MVDRTEVMTQALTVLRGARPARPRWPIATRLVLLVVGLGAMAMGPVPVLVCGAVLVAQAVHGLLAAAIGRLLEPKRPGDVVVTLAGIVRRPVLTTWDRALMIVGGAAPGLLVGFVAVRVGTLEARPWLLLPIAVLAAVEGFWILALAMGSSYLVVPFAPTRWVVHARVCAGVVWMTLALAISAWRGLVAPAAFAVVAGGLLILVSFREGRRVRRFLAAVPAPAPRIADASDDELAHVFAANWPHDATPPRAARLAAAAIVVTHGQAARTPPPRWIVTTVIAGFIGCVILAAATAPGLVSAFRNVGLEQEIAYRGLKLRYPSSFSVDTFPEGIRVTDGQITVLVSEWPKRAGEPSAAAPGEPIRFLDRDGRTYAVKGFIAGQPTRRARRMVAAIVASAHF